ncbi:TetR/AcrR family transcriptional regulator [Paraburkholderia megapolitana]|uniref:TetR/AcrR family transcriptional regulator n=1 Tax=Paraburkholderia megapolitana TaxID=420953 RepID=UPI0038BCF1EC
MAVSGVAGKKLVREEKDVAEIRRPTQERGRQKFEVILDTVDQFLQTREPADIGIYDIAEALGTSPPSVYHFFPTVSLVFVALAERYLEMFRGVDTILPGPFASWQQLLDEQCNQMLKVFEGNPAVRKVILGVGYSSEIRSRDLENNRILAQHVLDGFRAHFVVPEIPGLLDRFIEMSAINDAIWALYLHQDGRLTDHAKEIASRARVAYLRTILPEYLATK